MSFANLYNSAALDAFTNVDEKLGNEAIHLKIFNFCVTNVKELKIYLKVENKKEIGKQKTFEMLTTILKPFDRFVSTTSNSSSITSFVIRFASLDEPKTTAPLC